MASAMKKNKANRIIRRMRSNYSIEVTKSIKHLFSYNSERKPCLIFYYWHILTIEKLKHVIKRIKRSPHQCGSVRLPVLLLT